jgi:hypothetical protein
MRFLLLLNLLALGLGLGFEHYMSNRPGDLHEFNAGQIRFWSQPESYNPAAGKPPAADRVAKPDEALSGSLCVEITDFSQERYRELAARIKSAGLDDGQCSYSFDKRLSWWVFWPPEYEAAQRDKAVKAIQASGVKDVLPINQGVMAQAFSLGVFSSEAQANQHRDTLRGKGLSKVEFGPRPNMAWARLGCRLKEPAKREAFLAGMPDWAPGVPESQCGQLAALTVVEPGKPQ